MQRDDNGFPLPRKSYVISDQDGDSCYAYQVFSTTEAQAECPELFRALSDKSLGDAQFLDTADELTARLSTLRGYNRGAGRAFGTNPTIRIGKRNIVVRQFRGLDI